MLNKSEIAAFLKESFNEINEFYEMELISEEYDPYGVYILYKNQFAGYRQTYEYRENNFHLMIFHLEEGQVPAYSKWFDLLDLLSFRGIDSTRILSSKDFSEKCAAYINFMRQYATDFFRGKFDDFEALEVIVKERIRK